jgi:predicted  nucleic acid-binding Zn-ribbon protein
MSTKTKSSPSWLTPKEQKELERRGFLVKDYFWFIKLFKSTLPYISIIGIVLWIVWRWKPNFDSLFWFIFLWGIPFLLLLEYVKTYLRTGKLFFTNKNIFVFGKNYPNFSDFEKDASVLEIFDRWLNKNPPWAHLMSYKSMRLPENKKMLLLIPMQFAIVAYIQFLWLIWLFLVYITPVILLYFLRQLVEHFHPLYAFGNLGSRIQSLTPRISETSEKIEKEFSTDMNFRTLSHSFDTLSKDFSEISSYVLKLEQIEKKANKWNLFDSEKYIGSLREDIVKPLTTLRSFLEKKKTELEASEQEMKKVRIRVGWSWNWESENLELQSKRNEPLIGELTENISKLDVMIEKFGKI